MLLSPYLTLGILIGYFIILILISWFTSRHNDNTTFFTGNRDNPWYVIAFGMIGTSISGVTFISVPGAVGPGGWGYFAVVIGYILGYLVIGQVLMPMYYRMQLTSIYQYLQRRFGLISYKTGAWMFIVSRLVGTSLRLYIVVQVLQAAVFGYFGIPLWLTVVISVGLIYVYTFRAGVKTVIWTDTIQTVALVSGLVITLVIIASTLGYSAGDVISTVINSPKSQIFYWDWHQPNYFWKQFFGGAAIAIAMTGLDQDLMQKNLSCRNIGDAQKNMYTFTGVMVVINILFLSLGVMLYQYGTAQGFLQETLVDGKYALMYHAPTATEFVKIRTDELFTNTAFYHLGAAAALTFIIGVVAATYASSDSALTSLTTSFCVDILGFEKKEQNRQTTIQRYLVHVGLSLSIVVIILIFHYINDKAVIDKVLKLAGYTYGPLIGLFFYGILTKRNLREVAVPVVCVLSPVICYVLDINMPTWFGYKFGSELLIVNALITYTGLALVSTRPTTDLSSVSPS